MAQDTARILVLTDVASDAELVLLVLKDDYPQARACTDPGRFVAELEHARPQVLIYAYRALADSQQHHLNIHRSSKVMGEFPHVSLVLCDAESARQGFALCQSDFFDDYVLFWPMAHDARRLPMSIHLALRALAGQTSIGSMAQMTAQAGRVAQLDAQLDQSLRIGRGHSLEARQALQQAQAQVGNVLEKLARDIDGAAGRDAAAGKAAFERMRQEITGSGATAIRAPLQQADNSMAQLQAWVENLKTEIAEPLEAARALAAKSTRKRPRIMIVDDDDIMRKLMSKILVAQDYEVDAVSNAFAAMRSLQSELPDLILMDVQMPSIDGIQLTRRLKEIEAYAGIPVLMLTGRGERQVILDSQAAGAADFIVKPFERELLLQKLQRYVLRKPAADGAAT